MKFFLTYRKPLLIGLIAVTLVLGYCMRFVGVDFSFDAFFPRDEEYDFYQSYQGNFPNEDNAIFIALENGGQSVLDTAFLPEIDQLFLDLSGLQYVDTIISPTRLPYVKRSPAGVRTRDMVRYETQSQLVKSRKRIKADSLMTRNFFSEDELVIAGIVLIEDGILDKKARDTVCNAIEAKVNELPYKATLSGVPMIRTKFISKINWETKVFVSLSFALVILVLFFTYRSFWGVIVPLLGVVVTVVWCIGLMGLTGKDIDIMFELLPSIMFVVATSAIVHLVTKYIQELQAGEDKQTAIRRTLKKIGMAILLTSITTAIGFASLTVSKMPPIRDFGIYSAAGVMFAFLIAIILGPNVLLALNPKKLAESRGVGNLQIWDRWLGKLDEIVKVRSKWIALAFAAIMAGSLYGMSLISFDTYLLDDIHEEDPIRQNLEYFEEHFFGIRQFEMAVMAKEGHDLREIEIMEDLDQLQDYIQTQAKTSPFISPVSMVKNGNWLYHFNRQKYYRLPNSQEDVNELLAFAIASGGGEFIRRVMNKDYTLGRLSARMEDVGTDRFHNLQDSVETFYAMNLDTNRFDIRLTGSAVLAEHNVLHLRSALFTGLGLAFAVVGLIMGLLFRSWRMLFISLIPNLIPVIFTAGVMGFLGISLKSSASIVFVVSFGIAVDDTIHFLSRLKQELAAGNSIDLSIRNTLIGTGKALIITTIILMGGFILLILSNFGGVYVVGLFVCLTLLMGLLSDLLLMPVLVRWVYSFGKKKEK